MRLQELVQELGTVVGHDVDITSIVYDSREAQPGSLFVAVPGFRFDGHDYAAAAVQRGAVACGGPRFLTACATGCGRRCRGCPRPGRRSILRPS